MKLSPYYSASDHRADVDRGVVNKSIILHLFQPKKKEKNAFLNRIFLTYYKIAIFTSKKKELMSHLHHTWIFLSDLSFTSTFCLSLSHPKSCLCLASEHPKNRIPVDQKVFLIKYISYRSWYIFRKNSQINHLLLLQYFVNWKCTLGNMLNQVLSEGTIIVLRKIYQNKKYNRKVTTWYLQSTNRNSIICFYIFKNYTFKSVLFQIWGITF